MDLIDPHKMFQINLEGHSMKQKLFVQQHIMGLANHLPKYSIHTMILKYYYKITIFSMMLHRPLNFVDLTKLKVHHSNQTIMHTQLSNDTNTELSDA